MLASQIFDLILEHDHGKVQAAKLRRIQFSETICEQDYCRDQTLMAIAMQLILAILTILALSQREEGSNLQGECIQFLLMRTVIIL